MHSECVKREGTRLSPCQTFNQAHGRSTQRGVEVLIVDLHDADAHIIIMIYTLQRSLRPRKIRACTMYSQSLACCLQDGTLCVQGDPHVSVKTAHRLCNPSRTCLEIWVSSTLNIDRYQRALRGDSTLSHSDSKTLLPLMDRPLLGDTMLHGTRLEYGQVSLYSVLQVFLAYL